MGERTIFVDEFQDAASKDGDWFIIGKFTESVEWSNRNYSAVYDCRMIVLFQLLINSDGRGKHMYTFLTILFFYFKCLMRPHSEFFYEYNIFIVHLVFPLSHPNFVKIRFFFTINFISPLSSYAQITNVLFCFNVQV
jgi:hypothetical protein